MVDSIQLLNTYTVRTFDQIRDAWLRNALNKMIADGIPNPDVSPGTALYIYASNLATELAALGYNQQLLANGCLPDSAQGDDMTRQAALVGLSLQAATSSTGEIRVSTVLGSTPVSIPNGTQLVDQNGKKYQVNPGGLIRDGYDMQCISVDVGAVTNIADGSVLRWVTTPAFCNQTVVTVGTFKGGADAESIEDLRQRVLNVWQAPSVAGNASQINQWVEESSPVIQKSFDYPIAGGPGSNFIRIVSTADPLTKSRAINPRSDLDTQAFINAIVAPYVSARIPEYVEININDVTDQPIDVAIGLSLSAGQWANGSGLNTLSVWPSNASQGYVNVTTVVSSKDFTVNADQAPVPNVTQICWLSPVDWTLYSGFVTTVSGSAGSYRITTDQPFPNIAIGHWISPLTANSQQYFNAMISQFGSLGPSEMTDQAGVLPSALRIPSVNLSWPSTYGPSVLKFIVAIGNEILDVQYLYRTDLGAGPGAPTLPSDVSQKANILIPRNLGIYSL